MGSRKALEKCPKTVPAQENPFVIFRILFLESSVGFAADRKRLRFDKSFYITNSYQKGVFDFRFSQLIALLSGGRTNFVLLFL